MAADGSPCTPRPILSDLVEHHHAIAGAGLAQTLNDVAGEGADIGRAMTADLGFVVDAAQADADERTTQRAGDRLTERRLADARRPDETDDRRLAVRRELANGKVFDDPLFDLRQPKMVGLEDVACLGDIDRRVFGQPPGELDHPLEMAAKHS